jgi:hypothetical protein
MEKLSKLLLCLILAVTFAVSFIPHFPARAQVEEQQPKEEPQAIAAQAVITVVCQPEQLAEEIHKLNKQGISITKEDVQVVGDKVMIFIMVGTEGQEER